MSAAFVPPAPIWQVAEREVLRRPRPIGLWLQGPVPPVGPPRVAVVGTRRASPAVLAQVRALARTLVQSGAVVATGGAAGVDTAALQGALEAGGAPLVALAGGLLHWSPASNRALFEAVLANGGTVVSEQPPEAMPLLARFHARNRLLVRAVDAVVAVAGDLQGGTTSTVRAAWRQIPVLVPDPPWSAELAALPTTLRQLGAMPLWPADPAVWQDWLARLAAEPLRAWQPPTRWLPLWRPAAEGALDGQLVLSAAPTVDEPPAASPCYVAAGEASHASPWSRVAAEHADVAQLTARVVAILAEVAPDALGWEELACALQVPRSALAPLLLALTVSGEVEAVGSGQLRARSQVNGLQVVGSYKAARKEV